MLGEIDNRITTEQRKEVEKIEDVMQEYCDGAKGKEKTMVRIVVTASASLRNMYRAHTPVSHVSARKKPCTLRIII